MLPEKQPLLFRFDNTYANLPSPFFTPLAPEPTRAPQLVLFNTALAATLGLEGSPELSVPNFAGSSLPEGATPLAQAYAGHQFGHFTMLGDGRAVLLGEHITPEGARFDIQLKGSGRTPYSRRGDGRAALGPMLREYLISEAMHALGIPTTRGLAVISTGEPVFRERPLPGAILTRVASSHIRVGTFEYAAALDNPPLLRTLADYTIQRHYPALLDQPDPYLGLLRAVMERQASLLARWMNVGFIHGVMNTDNMALSGETIDYGPCAFIDHYSRTTVFSSIDHKGRYAFGNQARIAEWNLTRLAETLLPLLHADQAKALGLAQNELGAFEAKFEQHRLSGMRAKLGLASEDVNAPSLIQGLLTWMESREADFTLTFRALCTGDIPRGAIFEDPDFTGWHAQWRACHPDLPRMRRTNPAVIPRNHAVEAALESAVERSDYSLLHRLLAAVQSPYQESAEFSAAPPAGQRGYQTFCGT